MHANWPETGGCFSLEEPRLGATEARLFWDPRISADVLPLEAVSPVDRDAAVLDLDRLGVPTAVLGTPDGLQHVLFLEHARAFQLVVRGADVSAGVALRLDALPQRMLTARLNGLRRLSDLRAHGCLRPALYPRHAGAGRLQRVVQALDGWLDGASQRDIAAALFGETRVRRDWRGPQGHLRDQVRRAVGRGRFLMAGGYRRFLS